MSMNLMGRKKGMTRIFDENGNVVVCTVIQLEPNVVLQVKTKENDGYEAIQLAAHQISSSKKRNVSKPLLGHFAKAKVEPRKNISESRSDEIGEYEMGKEISVDYFAEVAFVDVTGMSKGKGFQGPIKRHGFKGGPAAHGSGFHRHMGSTGMRSTPGEVFKGKKMPGHMGHERITVENLKVIKVNPETNTMLVKGAVPGAKKGLLYVRKSIKRKNKKG